MWWIILFQLFYGIPLIIIYTISLFIMLAKRSQYKSSFFLLFLTSAPANLIIAINSFVSIRIPVEVSETNFLSPIYRTFLVSPFTTIFIFLTFQLFFTFQAQMLIMALNRLTAIFEPIRYEKLWSNLVVPLSIASYVLPLTVTYHLFFDETKFQYISKVQGYYLRFAGDVQPIYKALIHFILIVTLLTLAVNLLSVYLFIRRKSRNRAESALLFTSIAHFIIQSAVAACTVAFAFASNDKEKKTLISRIALIGYPYVSDAATLTSPLFLIAFSRQLRNDFHDLLKGNFKRKVPLVRQLSRKSMKHTISTLS